MIALIMPGGWDRPVPTEHTVVRDGRDLLVRPT